MRFRREKFGGENFAGGVVQKSEHREAWAATSSQRGEWRRVYHFAFPCGARRRWRCAGARRLEANPMAWRRVGEESRG